MRFVIVFFSILLLFPNISIAAPDAVFQIRPISEAPSNNASKMLDGKEKEHWVLNTVLVSESDLEKAVISEEPYLKGEFRITVFFKKDRAYKLFELTKRHVGQYVAIIVNKKLMMTPKIFEPIKGDTFVISLFSHQEAKKIADLINTAIEKK